MVFSGELGLTSNTNGTVVVSVIGAKSLIGSNGNLGYKNALQALIDGAAASAGLRIQAAYQVSSISTAMALVEQGLGVAALPCYSRPLRRAGSVRYRSLVAPVVRRDPCLLKLRQRVLSPEATEFSWMLL